jgi:acid phosphatase
MVNTLSLSLKQRPGTDLRIGISEYIYTKPVIARFYASAPSYNSTLRDIYAISLLCGSSPFCFLSLLTRNEWLGLEYTNDVQCHYNTGYGFPTSWAIAFP